MDSIENEPHWPQNQVLDRQFALKLDNSGEEPPAGCEGSNQSGHVSHHFDFNSDDIGMASSPEEDTHPVEVGHDDDDADALVDEPGRNFCTHGFIDFNGIVKVSRKRGLTPTQATVFLEQANATRQHYQTYLRKLGPSAWVGKRPGSIRYHVRSKSWKQLTSHRNINERGEEVFSYSWQTINRLPAGSADIADKRRQKAIKIARKMRTLICAYRTNHDSFYRDIDGWKPMKTLAVE